MLFLHEVHQVAGRREEEFEAEYRDGWMPSLAKGDDARLLYFLHHAHGTGRAYNVVTITAIRDGAAWEQLMLRLHDGDLQPWARDVDQLRHERGDCKERQRKRSGHREDFMLEGSRPFHVFEPDSSAVDHAFAIAR